MVWVTAASAHTDPVIVSQPFPPANPASASRERFVRNQNGWLFQGFSAESHLLWLGGHINAKREKYESLLLHWNKLQYFQFSLFCLCLSVLVLFVFDDEFFSASFPAILLVSVLALSVCTQSPLTNSTLKLYTFSFMNVPSLVETRVQLWMNCCNIVAAVYLDFCSLCWLVSTERQTKHSGGCQFTFLTPTDSLIKHSQPLQHWFTIIRIKIFIPWIQDATENSSEITWVATCFSCQNRSVIKTAIWDCQVSWWREWSSG